MDESYFRDKLSAWFDGDLPPEELAMMDKYVAESEEARRIVAEYRKLQEFVDAKSELGGEDYWERSAKRIEQAIGLDEETTIIEVKPQKTRWLRWQWVAAAASVAFLAFIGLHQTDIFKQVDEIQSPAEMRAPSWKSPAPSSMTPHYDTTAVQPVRDTAAASTDDAADERNVAGNVGKAEKSEVPVQEAVEEPPRTGAVEQQSTWKEIDSALSVESRVDNFQVDIVPLSATPPPVNGVAEQVAAVPKPAVSEPEKPAVEKKKGGSAAAIEKADIYKDAGLVEEEPDTATVIVVDIDGEDYMPDLSRSITVEGEPASPLDTIAVSDRPRILTEYRAQRDSLQPQMPSVREAVAEYTGSRPMGFAKSKTAQTAESDEVSAFDREEPPQEDLVEACYYIAAFTDDQMERDEVMRILKALAVDDESPAQDLAKTYLDDLQRFFDAGEVDGK